MRHIFVETNWVVALVAPTHLQMPEAVELRERAREGQLRLYLPAISLTEARYPVRTKYQPRAAADALRKYLRWATNASRIEKPRADFIRVALDEYEAVVLSELDELEPKVAKSYAAPWN